MQTEKCVCRMKEQVPIRVTIKAQRKILDRISLNDIRAVADLQQAVSLKTDPVMVPITVSCGRISADNIEVSPQNMSLHLEDKDTQEFVVNVNTNNTKPDRGYEIGALTSNPEKIKITGPVSLINKIDKVNASIDVDGAMEDVTQETDVKIIDKNGEEFTVQTWVTECFESICNCKIMESSVEVRNQCRVFRFSGQQDIRWRVL